MAVKGTFEISMSPKAAKKEIGWRMETRGKSQEKHPRTFSEGCGLCPG